MRKWVFLEIFFVFVFVLVASSFHGQIDVVSHLSSSIKAQDHQSILVITADYVVFERNAQVLTVDKYELNAHLADFFDAHPVKSFQVRHQGGSAHGAKYVIASYLSERGKNFVLKVKFLNKEGSLKISAIKFSLE